MELTSTSPSPRASASAGTRVHRLPSRPVRNVSPSRAGRQRPARRMSAVVAARDGSPPAPSGAVRASRKPGAATASLLSRTRTSSPRFAAPALTPAPKPRFRSVSTTSSPARRRAAAEPSAEALSTATSRSPPRSWGRIDSQARMVRSGRRQLTTTTRMVGRESAPPGAGARGPAPLTGRPRPPARRRPRRGPRRRPPR